MKNKMTQPSKANEPLPGIKEIVTPLLPPLPKRALSYILNLDRLDRIYDQIKANPANIHFLDKFLDALNINYTVQGQSLARIPSEGPVVVVANHPFGALDGIILYKILKTIRPDTTVMANYLLGKLPELSDAFLLVDPFETKKSTRANLKPVRDAVRWLRNGGLLGIFPAGEVSHLEWNKWEVTDPDWGTMSARLVRKTQATVVPAFFSGKNSYAFQVAGLIHPLLRTVMLPREMLRKANATIDLCFGKSIPFEKLERFENDQDMIKYMRGRTYFLAPQIKNQSAVPRNKGLVSQNRVVTTTPPWHEPGSVRDEVLSLPTDQLLVDTEKFSVYQARAKQIPHLMKDIGFRREVTFQAVGEGTGNEIDLDHFDDYYVHLFVWHKENQEVVGGYRLGFTDEIVELYGIEGLYTHTLFDYGQRFINQIKPAIELGRSFVRPEYQKTYHALMLLWKGIGQIVLAAPRYKTLFGPVSITGEYEPISRHLIAAFFRSHVHRNDLSRLVKPRTPLQRCRISEREIRTAIGLLQDIQELSDMVADLEADKKGIPILLKQYAKLGGKSVGFNIDPAFSNALDALIIVDLTQTDRRMLERYMGEEAAGAFLSYHSGTSN